MNISKEPKDMVGPFTIALLDLMDAYYLVDIVDEMKEIGKESDFGKAKAIADAFFVLNNSKWKSFEEMSESDCGYDVRIYNKSFTCVYASHEKYKEKWIGEA